MTSKNVLLNSSLSFLYHRHNLFSGTRWMKSYKVTLNDRIMVSKFVSWTSVKILFDNWLPNIPNKRSGAALQWRSSTSDFQTPFNNYLTGIFCLKIL